MSRLLTWVLFLVVAGGCATSRRSAPPQGSERGMASYYHDSLAGRPTASGEPYNPEAATCAHKTHPLGTRLRVTRVDSGASVVCRVNDRGPFVRGRVVDLSRRMARELGILHKGVVPVRVGVVSPPPPRRRREA
ncbi:MAG: septal ring lytic transglycosylase RlpA family protein [Myxococcota bacterium]